MILSENYLLRQIDDTYVLLPVGQLVTNAENVYKINESTYTILSELTEETSYEELLSRLMKIYEVTSEEEENFRKILDNCLAKMRKLGIILTNLF